MGNHSERVALLARGREPVPAPDEPAPAVTVTPLEPSPEPALETVEVTPPASPAEEEAMPPPRDPAVADREDTVPATPEAAPAKPAPRRDAGQVDRFVTCRTLNANNSHSGSAAASSGTPYVDAGTGLEGRLRWEQAVVYSAR